MICKQRRSSLMHEVVNGRLGLELVGVSRGTKESDRSTATIEPSRRPPLLRISSECPDKTHDSNMHCVATKAVSRICAALT
jgi:hypothetical protein